MSYPQPSSLIPMLESQDYFRLTTPLTSPGDTYESEVAGYAVAIGPDSDIARVNVAYFDPQASGSMRQIVVGNRSPFLGRIAPRMSQTYPNSGNLPGRILFTIADMVPQFNQAPFSDTPNRQTVIPQLDLIQYFTPQQSLPMVRNDRSYFFHTQPVTGVDSFTLNLPFYGRAWGSISVEGLATDEIEISGLRVSLGPAQAGSFPIRAMAAIGGGLKFTQVIDTATLGYFDMIQIVYKANNSGTDVTWCLFSDTPR